MNYYKMLFLIISSILLLTSCSSDSGTKRFDLTTTATPAEGGTVSPASGEFEEGEEVDVTASSNEHWVFDGWQGDLSGEQNPQMITMDADKDVAALFVKRDYPLTITTEGQGTVTEQVIQQKSTDYPYGTIVELTAEPEEDWEFEGWQGDIETTENPTTVTIEGETEITAVFSGAEYPLEITIEGEGTVNEEIVQPKNDYPAGTVVELTGDAEQNWIFSAWSGDLESQENPAQITVDEPKAVTATFLRTFNLTINADPEEGGMVSPESGQYVRDTTLEVEATPSQGWEFVEWEGDFSGTVNPFDLTMNGNKTITAIFERIEYPLTITVEGQGSVEQEVVQAKTTDYPYETIVQLTPVPDEAWVFEQWEGDVSSTEEVIEVEIEEETNITVRFTEMVYLANNGITIMCPKGRVGEVGIVNGVEYEVVDRELLDQRIEEEADLTRVCTSLVTDMSYVFIGKPFNQPIGNWDVSNVTNMRRMFFDSHFNQPIGNWDVSNVTDMGEMFAGYEPFMDTAFNQAIGNWDVSNVTDMSGMFKASSFNQAIGNWDVSNVKDMSEMFLFNTEFNRSIEDWDVSSVTNMSSMFEVSGFNQPIGGWDVSSVTDMGSMFFNSFSFNQPIGDWDVSSVTNMAYMFGASFEIYYDTYSSNRFNQPIGDWDVSSVKSMRGMFYFSHFNQPIGDWDVSNVTDMIAMFGSYDPRYVDEDLNFFNQPIGDWNVSSVTEMGRMFQRNSDFNQPIGDWDVSGVTDMSSMFEEAEMFNQSINIWCVSNIDTEPEDFSTASPLTEENKPIWGTCP